MDANQTIGEVTRMAYTEEQWQRWNESVFEGDTVYNESVFFLEQGEEKSLLYDIDTVLSVTNYDGSVTYERGRDYDVKDGRLVCVPGGAIETLGYDNYYGVEDSFISVMHDGAPTKVYWGEGLTMVKYHVLVTYTHKDVWHGFIQPDYSREYAAFLAKMERGEDVTVLFHGDSITYGCSAGILAGVHPCMPTFPMLFTHRLARKFGYGIRYVKPAPENTPPILPDEPGTRGTITYINTAVGGWCSEHGVKEYDTYIRPYIDRYGCDLFVYGYGMNDGNRELDELCANQKITVDNVAAQAPGVSVVLLATMVPNPEGLGWYGKQRYQEAAYLAASAHFRAAGIPTAVCRMTSVSEAVLGRKAFIDYAGNNINHPDDFFVRIYAESLFRCVCGE